MPRQPDSPEPNSILPHPELNPLLNPVLGDHMGQWAEVYFTSPPEKREEAVLQLLHELGGDVRLQNRGDVSGEGTAAAESDANATHEISHVDEQNRPPEIICACGAQNPVQRFCGMCGAGIEQLDSLEDRSDPLGPPIVAEEVDAREEGDRHFPGWRRADWDGESSNGGEGYLAGREPEAYEGPRLIPEHEPIPYRYRMYAGIALAILVGGLVYVAWRGTHAVPGSSRTLPPAAPAAAPAGIAQPQPAPTPKADTSVRTGTANPSRSDANNEPSRSLSPEVYPRPTAPAAAPAAKRSAGANTPNPATPPPSQVSTAKGTGSEELAIAENYLNGTHGKASDSAEAAKWLWKSVAKQNSAAALMLSDLYLRGSGVAKNCDQARLLLDIAARKGTAGAADQLRNLSAFGCQ